VEQAKDYKKRLFLNTPEQDVTIALASTILSQAGETRETVSFFSRVARALSRKDWALSPALTSMRDGSKEEKQKVTETGPEADSFVRKHRQRPSRMTKISVPTGHLLVQRKRDKTAKQGCHRRSIPPLKQPVFYWGGTNYLDSMPSP